MHSSSKPESTTLCVATSAAMHKSIFNLAHILMTDYKIDKEKAKKIDDLVISQCKGPLNSNDIKRFISTDRFVLIQFKINQNISSDAEKIVDKFHRHHIYCEQVVKLVDEFKKRTQPTDLDAKDGYEKIDFDNCVFNDLEALQNFINQLIPYHRAFKRLHEINFRNAFDKLSKAEARHELIRLTKAKPELALKSTEDEFIKNPTIRYFILLKKKTAGDLAREFYKDEIHSFEKSNARGLGFRDELYIEKLNEYLKILKEAIDEFTIHFQNLNYFLKKTPTHLLPQDETFFTKIRNQIEIDLRWMRNEVVLNEIVLKKEMALKSPAIVTPNDKELLSKQFLH